MATPQPAPAAAPEPQPAASDQDEPTVVREPRAPATEEAVRRLTGDLQQPTSAFPPIAGYGFLSDSENFALLAPGGGIEWLCLPRPDSPSVFGAMLDRDAGHFTLGPDGVAVPASRRYLPGTMVLETSWGTGSGWIIVRDVLLIGPWRHDNDRSHTHRRTPTDYDAHHVLLRMVRCVNDEVELTLDCAPMFDYRRQPRLLGIRRAPLPRGNRTRRGDRYRTAVDNRPAIGF